MVTKEDVLRLWRPDVPPDAIKAINRLLAERDAFRAVAWKYCALAGYATPMEQVAVDLEAKKIMEDGK